MDIAKILGSFYERHISLVNKLQQAELLQDSIYHYTSEASLKSILNTGTIWFTRRDLLNDPTEHLHIHKIVEYCLLNGSLNSDFVEHIKQVNNFFFSCKNGSQCISIDKNICLASFSMDGDALPMWNCYANSQQSEGYNIGFDFNLIRDNADTFCIAPVIYKQTIQIEAIFEYLSYLEDMWLITVDKTGKFDEAKNKINTALLDYTSEVGCLFKSKYYEYEKEVRIIVHPKSKMLKTRESNGRSVYYLPVQFEKNIVKSITSSPTMDRNIAQNKIKNIIEQEGYNVEIKHSNVPYRNSY